MGRRWSEERAELTLPCEAPPGLSAAQLHTYLLQVRLEEINKKLAHGDLRPSCYLPPGSAIPAALRAQLEDERARLIEEALKRNPEFMMPIDYASHIRDNRNPNPSANAGNTGGIAGGASGTLTDASGALTPAAQALLNEGGIRKIGNRWAEKIWIPQRDFPDVNFVGLLIGPRGNTLKKMEAESGARISIRGKGSLKEGGAGSAGAGSSQGLTTSSSAGADEELHALVTGDGSEKVARASRLINRIIETAVSTPEAANELKRFQLRELAALNGTLRDEEQIICANCGQPGHRRFECLERKSVTASTLCRICGGAGHLASDCVHKHDPAMLQQSKERSAHMDNEYLAFMSEISGTPNANAGASGNANINVNANSNAPDAAYQMDPLQVQQYYAALMQQQTGQAAWDPAAYAQAWHIPPPPGQ